MRYKVNEINPEWLVGAAAVARVEPRMIDAVEVSASGDVVLDTAVGTVPVGNVGTFDNIKAEAE